jgi:hypothetical protein
VIGPPILTTHGELVFGRIWPEEVGYAVRSRRFSEEQIVAVLRQVKVGVPITVVNL